LKGNIVNKKNLKGNTTINYKFKEYVCYLKNLNDLCVTNGKLKRPLNRDGFTYITLSRGGAV
jgi:hypothetical protein